MSMKMLDESMITIMNMTTSMPSNGTTVPWIPFLDSITQIKIWMAVGLLLTVAIVTLLPFLLVRYLSKKWDLQNRGNSIGYKRFTTWMSRINCFAGGVFLSTGFMDIFPEMLESIQEAKEKNKMEIKFPLGPFLTLMGFFMILIIEETVLFIKTKFYGTSAEPAVEYANEGFVDQPFSSTSDINRSADFTSETKDTKELPNTINLENGLHDHSLDHAHHEHHEHGLNADALSRGNLSVTILMIAISVHSIFEGLALGLEKDSAGASRLFLALCLHKYVIAITIGLQISKSSLGIKMACLCSGIFAFATPFGVVLGFWVMYLQRMGNTSFSMVAGVLQGLACGTFFYIVFFEILPEEFSKKYDKLFKIIALILGFGLVSIVMLLVHE